MTTTLQLSDKGGESGQALLVVKIEAPDEAPVDRVYARFVEAVAEVGLQATLDTFDDLVKAKRAAVAGLGAQPVAVGQPPSAPAVNGYATGGNVVQGAWGQPPVPPMQPQMPAAAAAPAAGQPPSCPHGVREYISGITKSGKNAGRPWQAWACPADRNDPSKCEKEWIRD